MDALKQKLSEHERLMTWALLLAIVVDAYFDLGIDLEHWAMMLGVSGSFAVSRGLAKRGASAVLPAVEKLAETESKDE